VPKSAIPPELERLLAGDKQTLEDTQSNLHHRPRPDFKFISHLIRPKMRQWCFFTALLRKSAWTQH
jgi:hypothetical protein